MEGKTLYPSKTYSDHKYSQLTYHQKGKLLKATNRAHEGQEEQNRSIHATITESIEAALRDLNPPAEEQNQDNEADSTGNKRAIVLATDQLKRRRGGG